MTDAQAFKAWSALWVSGEYFMTGTGELLTGDVTATMSATEDRAVAEEKACVCECGHRHKRMSPTPAFGPADFSKTCPDLLCTCTAYRHGGLINAMAIREDTRCGTCGHVWTAQPQAAMSATEDRAVAEEKVRPIIEDWPDLEKAYLVTMLRNEGWTFERARTALERAKWWR